MVIDSNTSRLDILAHLMRCRSCVELLAYARRAGDREALAAWRAQLAAHLEPPPRPARSGAGG